MIMTASQKAIPYLLDCMICRQKKYLQITLGIAELYPKIIERAFEATKHKMVTIYFKTI